MQLILNTESTVDINEKMSLNEDNLEKGKLGVQSAVANGNITNGDIVSEANGAGDSNKKLEQVNEDSVKTIDHELEQLTSDDISHKADIESFHESDNDLNQIADMVNGKDDSTNNESLMETEINDVNTIADASENEPVEAEQNYSVSDRAVAQFNHENSADIKIEHNEIFKINTGTELNNESMTVSSIADEKECFTAQNEDVVSINADIELNDVDCTLDKIQDELEVATAEKGNNDAVNINAEVELNDELGTVDSIANTTESVTVEKETNNLKYDTEIEINSKHATTNIDVDGNSITCNENAIPNIIFDHEDGDLSKEVENNIEENQNVSDQIEKIKSEDQMEDVDMMPEIENTINSKNDEEMNDSEESSKAVTNNIEAKKVNIFNSEPNSQANESEANISVTSENFKMETEETDTSDENIDLINLNFKNESEDVLEGVKKELEQGERGTIKVEEKETTKTDKDDTTRKPDLMDVDESTENAKVMLEANSEASAQNISDTNKKSSSTFTMDCYINKPILEKNESVNLVQDSSDDVIFNIDDDKEQEDELVEPKEPESTEVIANDDKPASSFDSTVSRKSDDIIHLDKNVSKNKIDAEAELVKQKEPESTGVLADDDKPASSFDSRKSDDIIDLDENVSKNTIDAKAELVKPKEPESTGITADDDKPASSFDSTVSRKSDDVIDLDENVTKNTTDVEAELVKSKESESTEVVEDDDKPASNFDSTVSRKPDDIIDLDENVSKITTNVEARRENTPEKTAEVPKIPPVLKLSNTLNILSDDEDEPKELNLESKCINIEDDDDVMLIDEDTGSNETNTKPAKATEKENHEELKAKSPEADMEINKESDKTETEPTSDTEIKVPEKQVVESTPTPDVSEKVKELSPEREDTKPLLHEKFLKACKKNLSEMTREELEEFCILKIVESVIDRSSLSEVKAKLKTLTQNVDEHSKKVKMLTKQNRDLQVVLKSVQEDQKKGVDNIVPLKITRSVGMQVLMTDKVVQRRKGIGNLPSGNAPVNKQLRNPVIQSPRPQKQQAPQIPVPRLVPANNPTLKSPSPQQPPPAKIGSPLPNGIRNPSPVQKAEKRTHNRIQSVTVDLTDDEPPAKVVTRAQPPAVPPVRLVPSQNLLAPPRQPTIINSPRKVYIPISGPQGQNVRAGQTIMLKTVPTPGPRQRCPPPHMVRMPQNMRMQRPQGLRHPAPLPDCMKQYQPPNWKALPPAPDLKLAKVENGIVISWKIEGYQEDSYEEIASYQLYAYQETASPPNTALWKKIGDVKALPLPMACTLTQFMAGYKYYFAVRAVDIRSRLGPFSLPGSILLLNKM